MALSWRWRFRLLIKLKKPGKNSQKLLWVLFYSGHCHGVLRRGVQHLVWLQPAD